MGGPLGPGGEPGVKTGSGEAARCQEQVLGTCEPSFHRGGSQWGSGRWPTRAPWFSQAWASAFPLHTWLSPAEAGPSGRQSSVAHKLAGSEPGPGSGSVLPGAGPVPLSPRAHVSRSVGLQAPVTGPVIRSPPELTVPLPMHLLGPPLAEWPRLCVERLGWPGLLGGKCQGFPCHPPHTLPTLGCLC